MAKEPTRGNSQGYLKEFFLANPPVVLSLLYLYVTAVGMFYSAALYGRFGINVFDYSEIGDFLLAAFKNPIAFLSAALVAAMGGSLVVFYRINVKRKMRRLRDLEERHTHEDERIREMLEKSIKEKEARVEKRLGIITTVVFVSVVIVVIVLSSVVLPYISATRTATAIKQGERAEVDIRYRSFKGSAGQITVPGLRLIGATQKAAFFYDVDHKHTLVVPQSQIVSIEVPEQD